MKLTFDTAARHGYGRKYPTRPYLIKHRGSWTVTMGKWWVTLSWSGSAE